MNISIILQVGIPTFVLLVIGVALTVYEFHKSSKYFDNIKSGKKKSG